MAMYLSAPLFKHREYFAKLGSREERGISVHGADTFVAVFFKLLTVYAQENAGVFLVWQTVVQRIKLQNVGNRIGENSGYVFCERF